MDLGDKYDNDSLSLIPYRFAIKMTDETSAKLISPRRPKNRAYSSVHSWYNYKDRILGRPLSAIFLSYKDNLSAVWRTAELPFNTADDSRHIQREAEMLGKAYLPLYAMFLILGLYVRNALFFSILFG
jgi:hypothetical protein